MTPVSTILLLHLAAAVLCLAGGRRLGRRVLGVAASVPATAFAWSVAVAPRVLDGRPVDAAVAWVPQLDLDLVFRVDGFGLLMGLLVSGIGVGVLVYSTQYFRPHGHGHGGNGEAPDDGAGPDLARLAGLLVGFAGAMLGLVWSDGILTLFLCWELTSITSFALIGFQDRSAAARSAAVRAFLVTGAGGLAMLGGLVLLGQRSGTWTISGLVAERPTGTAVTVGLVLVLVGAFAKSAQVPLHFWLPGAMAAPTPVSAYLHSATMVKAGLVVVARLAPSFAGVGPWRLLVVVAGGASLLLGGIRALRQTDAKLALAHGTVSQLGLLMILLGLGTPGTTYAGVALLCAHALFKASLFLGVGVVDHQCGTRDLRRLHALGRALPVVAGAVAVAAASMAAVPPTFGYVAKEVALDDLLHADVAARTLIVAVVVAGSVLTVAYTTRLALRLLGPRPAPGADAPVIDPSGVERAGPVFVSAPLLLAALSLLFGLAAAPVGTWLARASSSLDPASAEGALKLWPGLHPALALSALTWVLGGALGWWVVRVERGEEPSPGAAVRAYQRTYDGLLAGARRLTAVTQSGSLPAYLAVVLVVLLAALVGALALDGPRWGEDLRWWNSPTEAALAVVCGLLAVGVARATRRFVAALLLGGSGVVLALVFLSYGAPDLAITQFLVESLTIVLFLLVLGRLPDRFDAAPRWAPKALRVALSVAVGLAVAGFALTVSQARTDPSVGREYLARSVPEGGGRNVVNVTLVDFRGFDTLGEITVLAVAAVGVVNLVGAARREQRRKRLADGTDRPAPAPGGSP